MRTALREKPTSIASETEASIQVTPEVRLAPFWLWLSVPIAVLAIAGSVTGILIDRIYEKETANWAAQGFGQDIANLVAYPVLLLLAFAARRGSVRAYLAWLGVLVSSVYMYAIYAFAMHFGPLFLLDVAVFGLSVWALIGGLSSLDPVRVRRAFTVRTRSASGLLIGIGCLFTLMWLSEILPPTFDDTTPEALVDSGLLTNPVHVLDLSVLLPAAVLGGVLLWRRRAWGYVIAPVVLSAFVLIGLGILSLMAVLAVRGEDASPAVATLLGAVTVVELAVVIRFLRGDGANVRLGALLRPTAQEADRPDGWPGHRNKR